MSRGPGRIERAILAAFAAEPDAAFTTEELAGRAYPGAPAIGKAERVAVLRAAGKASARAPWLRSLRAEALGGQRVFFDCTRVASYAMARLKASGSWASRDGRGDGERAPEAALRARLEEGGDRHAFVAEGGAWWRHVASWRAELDAMQRGDADGLAAVRAEREA